MYNNVAIGVGNNKIGYKISGKKRYAWEETQRIVVMQCTGYRDSQDKKIFDRDIVRFDKRGRKHYLLRWRNYKFLFKKVGTKEFEDKFKNWKKSSYVEIIGNYFENPELLE